MKLNQKLSSGLMIAALSLLTACGGGSGDATASPATSPTPVTPAPGGTACPSSVTPLSQAEVDEALFMREEEKLARDVYLDLSAYWQVQVGSAPVVNMMSNIAKSEQTHMDSMKDVLSCYGLPDPVDAAATHGVFINPELAGLYIQLMTQGKTSQLDALKVGALIEEVDIEDLQTSIELSQQAYTDQVYEALMCGSRNHLRSFAGEIIKTTGTYKAQVIPQATVDAILSTPNETCGGAGDTGGSPGGGGKQNGKP